MCDRNNFDDADDGVILQVRKIVCFLLLPSRECLLNKRPRKERALRDLKIRKLQNESSCSRKRLRQYYRKRIRALSCDLVGKTTRDFSFVEKPIRKKFEKFLIFTRRCTIHRLGVNKVHNEYIEVTIK